MTTFKGALSALCHRCAKPAAIGPAIAESARTPTEVAARRACATSAATLAVSRPSMARTGPITRSSIVAMPDKRNV